MHCPIRHKLTNSTDAHCTLRMSNSKIENEINFNSVVLKNETHLKYKNGLRRNNERRSFERVSLASLTCIDGPAIILNRNFPSSPDQICFPVV